jgi:hypothetical protein
MQVMSQKGKLEVRKEVCGPWGSYTCHHRLFHDSPKCATGRPFNGGLPQRARFANFVCQVSLFENKTTDKAQEYVSLTDKYTPK